MVIGLVEVYLEQLTRVLGPDTARATWAGGEDITPHTPLDPRCAWDYHLEKRPVA